MKVIAGSLAAFVAGFGGALLAMAQSTFQPNMAFATFAGVVWLAVLVTIGIRSNAAALFAGVTFVMAPALVQAYLPAWVSNVLPVLFGLGAISAAKFPDGSLAEQSRQLRRLVLRLRPPRPEDLELAREVSMSVSDAEPMEAATPGWPRASRDGPADRDGRRHPRHGAARTQRGHVGHGGDCALRGDHRPVGRLH